MKKIILHFDLYSVTLTFTAKSVFSAGSSSSDSDNAKC